MTHEVLPNGDLKISVDDTERQNIRLLFGDRRFDTDGFLFDILENWMDRTGIEWSAPWEIGALTDAPCLAEWGEDRPLRRDEQVGHGNRIIGRTPEGATLVQDPVRAWAFMDYQVRSAQRDLMDKGFCIFQSGN